MLRPLLNAVECLSRVWCGRFLGVTLADDGRIEPMSDGPSWRLCGDSNYATNNLMERCLFQIYLMCKSRSCYRLLWTRRTCSATTSFSPRPSSHGSSFVSIRIFEAIFGGGRERCYNAQRRRRMPSSDSIK